jgi:hypothetical protein
VIVKRLAKVTGLEAIHAETGRRFAEVEAEGADETPEPTARDGGAA